MLITTETKFQLPLCLMALFLLLLGTLSYAGAAATKITETAPAQKPLPSAEENELATIRVLLEDGHIDEAVAAYNRHRMAHPVQLDAGAQLEPLARWLRTLGYNDREIVHPLLEPRDATYLRRAYLLSRIAHSVIKTATPDAEKAKRLFEFVTQEIRPHVPTPYLFEHPVDVLIRGHGSCDQMAWTLVALAEQCDLHGAVVFLRNPKTGISPHSLALLRVDGAWRTYDPFTARTYAALDAALPPDLLRTLVSPKTIDPSQTDGTCLLVPEHLPWAQYLVHADPRGNLPRWNLFSYKLKTKKMHLRLWWNPVTRLAEFRRDFAKALSCPKNELGTKWNQISTVRVEKTGGKPISRPRLAPYGEPLAHMRREADAIWAQRQAKSLSQSALRPMRILYLTGQAAQALTALDSLQPEQMGTNATAAGVILAQCMQQLGKYEDASNLFASLSENRTASLPAAVHLSWNRAVCLLAAGKKAEAHAVLLDVPEPRRAAARRLAETLR